MSDVVAHGEQQLSEVLGLCRCLVAEDAARYFGQSVHYLGYLLSEDVLQVFHGVVGVFHHIVEQCRADAGGAESHLLCGYLRHGYGVHDIGFAREAPHAFVGLFGEVVGFGYDVHLLSVGRGQIAVEHLLEGIVHHPFLFLFLSYLLVAEALCFHTCVLLHSLVVRCVFLPSSGLSASARP